MYNYKDIDIINDKARFYAKELWGKKFDKIITVNNRLKRNLAWFIHNQGIEISKTCFILNEYHLDDILLHELSHWYCFITDKKYSDYDKDFEDELEKIGASSTCTTQKVNDTYMYRYMYGCYECEECKKVMRTKDFLEEKEIDGIGRPVKMFKCCNKNMKFTGMRYVPEPYIPNEKILTLNNKFKEYYKKRVL